MIKCARSSVGRASDFGSEGRGFDSCQAHMKIEITKLKTVPKKLSGDFELYVFGNPDQEIQAWISHHDFSAYTSGQFTNIKIDKSASDIFLESNSFEYMDGFSPNLKSLHIGHLSNLVLAKAFKSIGIAKKSVSLFGDTLDVEGKDEALRLINKYCSDFDYTSDHHFASNMIYKGNLLKDGSGEYEGTKIFEIGDHKEVGIKSNGQTSYFYQDMAFADLLRAPTVYLTGNEQCNHFGILKKIHPHIHHIGLGLVKVQGQKMATRVGNVILVEEFIETAKNIFGGNLQLIYNVFAGHILKAAPGSEKNINLDMINNPKNSGGLYISYTMARMHSAGMEFISGQPSNEMLFSFMKAKETYSPHYLYDHVINMCKKINGLYLKHTIKDNIENQKMFQPLLSDLLWGSNKLGMFTVCKV